MSEDALIPIVNEHDEIITYKPRRQIEPGDIGRIATLWVMNSQGDLLLAQRSLQKKSDPGLWGMSVAGTVEQGETYESNIIKEAEEEIGLRGLVPEYVGKILYPGSRPFIGTIFKTIIDQPVEYFTRQIEEVEQLVWVPYDTLVQDLKTNPRKYVPSLPAFLKHLPQV